MISIIICSQNKVLNEALNQNIIDTIGDCLYEIVFIDNSNNKYSIFEAYNLGVEKAIYPYLCFIHEDIIFRTKKWGLALCRVLDNKDVGIVGVIGCKFLMDLSYGWWEGVPHIGRVLQNRRTSEINYQSYLNMIDNPSLEDAVACDGLFMAMSKQIFRDIRFDTNTYSGFHCYDIDICMQAINKGYQVKILENLWIEHLSIGYQSDEFAGNMYKFYKKWKSVLHIACRHVTSYEIDEARDRAVELFYNNNAYLAQLSYAMSKGCWKYCLSVFLYIDKIYKKIIKRQKYPIVSD